MYYSSTNFDFIPYAPGAVKGFAAQIPQGQANSTRLNLDSTGADQPPKARHFLKMQEARLVSDDIPYGAVVSSFVKLEISSLIEVTVDNAIPTEEKSTEMEDDAMHQE
ncbi:hypothetical protein DKX38_015444 [Salix brachista]|uniref:Uncharacterized protein n=1 Tax=Salix brachista TaxID=2182728 RepID=A0A5N5L720_9ROSI|nr:hypothetical protein DKX38_015444 [Salix brachista]